VSSRVVRGSLDAVFRPRSVAVIGASRRRGTIGAEVFHNILSCGFSGAVYPVNPKAPSVQAVRAYASIVEVPDSVDLAILAVPHDAVFQSIEECAIKGVQAVVVLSAGFGEAGPEGRRRQAELLGRIRTHGMRMIGPNCLGVLNTEPHVGLNATFAPTWPPTGTVGLASQSGAVGLALLDYARQLGIGISQFVSMGNKADVSGNDLLEHWEDDDGTRVVILYLESLGNPLRFMELARRVSRKKPVLVVKSGRTEAGARAASSHTGALAGMEIAVDALFGQAGVVRADTIEELFDVAMLLANQPVPAGPRVGILTNAGGPGIMASDACESRGLVVPQLSESTQRELRAFLPPSAAVSNPVDMLASAPPSAFETSAQKLLADDNIDALIVLFVPPMVTDAAEVAAAVRRASAASSKPVLTSFLGTHGVPAALASLREGKIPSYAFPESAVRALSLAVRYATLRDRPAAGIRELANLEPTHARALLGEISLATAPRWLGAEETRGVLGAYGIRTPRSAVATDAPEALRAAESIGFPVALKLRSSRIVHKTEVDGVQLNLRSPAEVTEAFARVRRGLDERGLADAFDGVLVQEMISGGVETYVGMTEAPGFGALIALGMGGTAVEVWRDVAFRVHPISTVDVTEMVNQLHGKKLLDGFRGALPADQEAVMEAVLRVDRMVGDLPEIHELDLNPLLALPKGLGVVALDARIRVGPPRTSL